eukprot:403368970
MKLSQAGIFPQKRISSPSPTKQDQYKRSQIPSTITQSSRPFSANGHENSQNLRIIMQALCDKNSVNAIGDKKSPQSLMFHAQMFGFLVKCQEHQNMIINQKERQINAGQFIIEPLMKILASGRDPIQQQGASFCINYLIEYCIKNDYFTILDQIHEPILQILSFGKLDNKFAIESLMNLINYLGVEKSYDYLENFINQANKLIQNQSSAIHSKKAAFDLLSCLGDNIRDYVDVMVPSYLAGKRLNKSGKVQKLSIILKIRNKESKSYKIQRLEIQILREE